MKVLVIGGGGREHAIAWKLASDKEIEKVYVAPGNGGTALEDKCENVDLSTTEELINFAKSNDVDYTVVGPEDPLTKGIVDDFEKENLKIFGPCKKGAILEGSKAYSKEFMKKYNVKTAEYEIFNDIKRAVEHLKNCEYPVVIKADGLAAGKGVVICNNYEEGKYVLEDFMVLGSLNKAGKTIVIEEFLEGIEASILSVTDGNTIIPFISAKDHKQVLDGDKGLNTGGMGVIAPNPYVTEDIFKSFEEEIMYPTLKGLKSEKIDFKGIIFFGIMITKKGIYLLEYNVRMGDPETQAVLSLMETSLHEVIKNTLDGNLHKTKILWKNKVATCVVICSGGYPLQYKKDKKILITKPKEKVFIAGAILKENSLYTSGGRVLSVVAVDDTIDKSRKKAYDAIEHIEFHDMFYRKDIGKLK